MIPKTSSRFRLLVTLLALVLGFAQTVTITSTSAAAEFDLEKLAALNPRMQRFVDEPGENQVAGLVLLVGNAQGQVYELALGKLRLNEETPMAKNTLFRIASMTKPITALGIMVLQDEGKLSVTDPVEKYLPEFKGQMLIERREGEQVILKPAPRSITLHDLLTHTSGLPGGFPAGYADLYSTRQLSLAEATLMQSQRPLEFAPGSRWAYCNAGIDTLGRIIEVVSGQSYEKFLTERFFAPLGMNDTTPYPTEKQLERLAQLHGSKEGQLHDAGFTLLGPTKGARHPIPAGGLYSTAADMARLYQMMLQKGKWAGKQIVSEKAVAQMTAVQTGDLPCGFTPGMSFGYGWAVVNHPEGVHAMLSPGTFGHGGAFGTQGWVDPQQGLFVILLIQRVGLPNADASPLRGEFQRIVVEAIKK